MIIGCLVLNGRGAGVDLKFRKDKAKGWLADKVKYWEKTEHQG